MIVLVGIKPSFHVLSSVLVAISRIVLALREANSGYSALPRAIAVRAVVIQYSTPSIAEPEPMTGVGLF